MTVGALRFFMVALVLVNLAFVSITEAARWIWLAPLLAATLLSPLLVRFASYRLYRATWNLSLIGVFGLLVQHTFDAGVARMLEDGLLLAALCQVHLLNNLRSDQQPDLLFFNSFLIAVVTSFLSIDVEYFALFLVYAPLLVTGMQMLALSKSGVRMPVRRVAFSGMWRAGVVLGLTMLVFVAWPRDFRRKGLLGERLQSASAGAARVDFSDQVLLDRVGDVTASDRVVLRVRGPRRSMPQYWRGATMHRFEGNGWKASSGVSYRGVDKWRQRADGWWMLGRRAREPELHVLSLARTQRLFLPLEAARMRMEPPAHFLRIQGLPDHTFWHVPYGQQIAYKVRLREGEPRKDGAISSRPFGALVYYVGLPRNSVPDEAIRLADEVRARVELGAPQHEFVEAVRAELSRRYRYLPPGADGGSHTLEAFFGGTPGHCEYFATALCVMLRTQGVPCRLVTGYRSDEWEDGTLKIRELHAHAWAEVLDPVGGWYTVDPSPSLATAAAANSGGFLKRIGRWAQGLWTSVTGFDEKARADMLVWLSTVPRKLLWPSVGTLIVAVALAVLRRRREPAAVRAYHRALRRHKTALGPGETPRQLADRVPELADATAAHERERYASTA